MERPNFGGNLEIATHQVLEDRIEAAKILLASVDDEGNTILVDTMANHASKAYAATLRGCTAFWMGRLSWR